jgi:hydroxymethylpyrimidine pyrophosphatase-like HAD family hydrolase
MLTDSEKTSDDAMLAYNVYPAHVRLLRTAGEGIENFEAAMRASESVDMISLFFKTNSALENAKSELLKIKGIGVVSACDYNLEITYSKAGKGNALSTLAESLGVKISETIAIGDSENDLQMLKAAGLGIAPSNAAADIREKATDVSCSNDENVVPYILEKYF